MSERQSDETILTFFYHSSIKSSVTGSSTCGNALPMAESSLTEKVRGTSIAASLSRANKHAGEIKAAAVSASTSRSQVIPKPNRQT